MVLAIVEYPDPILKKILEPVSNINDDIRQLVDDMLETMYNRRGVGLAANQVNHDKRIFVMDMTDDKSDPIVFINPEIIETEGELIESEGCLSFPGIFVKVKRPQRVTIKAHGKDGKAFTREFQDYTARCVLHEMDHINGITFFDRLGPVTRKMAEKKLAKTRKQRM